MILVTDADGKVVAREDYEGGDLGFCIEELQPLLELPGLEHYASPISKNEMLVEYPQKQEVE